MKSANLILVFLAGLLLPWGSPAQGTLQVSNLGETPTGSAAIGNDAWIAQRFATGNDPNGYELNSVQLLMNPASGTPGGFAVSIYSSSLDGLPAVNLGTLAGPDPSAGGVFAYAASGITFSTIGIYFVVLTAQTPVGQGAYDWSATGVLVQNPENRWMIGPVYCTSTDGSIWSQHPSGQIFQLGIYATPVPEPQSVVLAALGIICLSLWPRKTGEHKAL